MCGSLNSLGLAGIVLGTERMSVLFTLAYTMSPLGGIEISGGSGNAMLMLLMCLAFLLPSSRIILPISVTLPARGMSFTDFNKWGFSLVGLSGYIKSGCKCCIGATLEASKGES